MDKIRAKAIAKGVEGCSCNGWIVGDYINNGKSAVVCQARRGDQIGAIKLFDPEMVERYGCEVQRGRIETECKLIGTNHPNLAAILDGGEWAENGFFYITMEYLPWRNLAEALIDLPSGIEQELLQQLVAAAVFLESHGLCHRDIKPDNIAISDDFKTLKLLDFGVIRPIGSTSGTDGSTVSNFVGTTRYSPPEFLLRQEEDTPDGWRAVTIYQIGGVLHDLIMREPLFRSFDSPPAVLVNAVQHEIPSFEGAVASSALIDIARSCLMKSPKTRLSLIGWDSFVPKEGPRNSVADMKARILRRRVMAIGEIVDIRPAEPALPLSEIVRNCSQICRTEIVRERAVFPPLKLDCAGDEFKIHFAPSSTHFLKTDLFIEFSFEWVDPAELAIRLYAASSSLESGHRIEIFSGAFNSESVAPPMIEILYRSMEAAN